MRREYKIKWTESQWRRLDSAVRRYNNAIRREKAKTPNAELYMPPEASYKELKASITTARALKNVVNRLNRISRPGALQPVLQKDGSIVTKYERHEYAILKSVREKKKAAEARIVGQPAKHSIGSYIQNAVKPDTRKPEDISSRGLRRFIETQEREMNMSSYEKAERYYENYITALNTVFKGFDSYEEQMKDIKKIIEDAMNSNSFELIEWLEDSPSIQFIYDPYEREYRMNELWEYWSKKKEGKSE